MKHRNKTWEQLRSCQKCSHIFIMTNEYKKGSSKSFQFWPVSVSRWDEEKPAEYPQQLKLTLKNEWHHKVQMPLSNITSFWKELWWQNLGTWHMFCQGNRSCMISMNLKVHCGQCGYEVCACICVWWPGVWNWPYIDETFLYAEGMGWFWEPLEETKQ